MLKNTLKRLFPSLKTPDNILKEYGSLLKIQELRSKFLSPQNLHLIQVRDKQNHLIDFAGLGIDTNFSAALLKAMAEYFERKALIENGSSNFSSTNGLAAHPLLKLAQRAAYFELTERDAFLAHWYTKTPFLKVDPQKNIPITTIELLLIEGYDIHFAETYLGYEPTIVCFLVCKQSQGFVIGLSCGRGKKNIEKAFHEAVVNLEFVDNNIPRDDLLQKLETEGLTTLSSHRSYWRYKRPLPHWTLSTPINTKCLQKKLKPIKVFETTKFLTLAAKPFFVAGAVNPNLLPLRIGAPNENDLAMLTRRVNFDNSINDPDLIHPLP